MVDKFGNGPRGQYIERELDICQIFERQSQTPVAWPFYFEGLYVVANMKCTIYVLADSKLMRQWNVELIASPMVLNAGGCGTIRQYTSDEVYFIHLNPL